MATREDSISEIGNILDEPMPQAPSLHRIAGTYLRYENQMRMKLNNSGIAWAIQSFDLTSDPETDTYTVPAANFGKPLSVVKATEDERMPYVQIGFDDLNQLDYGTIRHDPGFLGALAWDQQQFEKMSFYREGAINPINRIKLQPLPQTAQVYTVTYAIGDTGRFTDDRFAVYAIPELANWVEINTALAMLPYAKWYADDDKNSAKRKELMAGISFQASTINEAADQYIRSMTHPRPVEIEVLY